MLVTFWDVGGPKTYLKVPLRRIFEVILGEDNKEFIKTQKDWSRAVKKAIK